MAEEDAETRDDAEENWNPQCLKSVTMADVGKIIQSRKGTVCHEGTEGCPVASDPVISSVRRW